MTSIRVIQQARKQGVQVLSKWAGAVSFGLLEQVILTGVNFAFTAAMGHLLGATSFGWLSIAWVLLQFLETSSMGLFGDGVPASARRLPVSSRAAFRATFLTISFVYSMAILALLVAMWPVAVWLDLPQAGLIPATGLAFVGFRAQNAARRLYYLEGLRKEAAAAALINAMATIAGTVAFAILLRQRDPAVAMLIVAAANILSALVLFAQRNVLPLAPPTWQLVYWARERLWRTGRWLLASNAMSWLGNFGPVVLIGMMVGVSASGTLRVIMTLIVPPAQMVIVLMSIMIPRFAAKSRQELRQNQWSIALRAMTLIGFASGTYAVLLTSVGGWFPRLVFGEPAAGITQLTVAIASFGYAIESIRYGCNVVLLARGEPEIMTLGQVLALISALVLIPSVAHFGFNAVILAGTISNNVNTLAIFLYFYFFLTRDRKLNLRFWLASAAIRER
jgi:O-antigen/teichoic acid export membrane protein